MYKSAITAMLRRLASLRLTLIGMLSLLGTIFFTYEQPERLAELIVYPLLLLAINLLAALFSNVRFRYQPWLMIFHVCLLLVVVLAGTGLLLRFEGRVEIAEGQHFRDATVHPVTQGGWYQSALHQVDFIQGPIEVDYHSDLRRGTTRSILQLPGMAVTNEQLIQIGDQQTYQSANYRFATTSNKGYAARLAWQDAHTRQTMQGFVHFPSFPAKDWKQEMRWRTPRGEIVQLTLKLDSPVKQDANWTLRSAVPAYLHIKGDEQSVELAYGEALNMQTGTLRFEGVVLWMGYQVDYNPLLPWLFTAALCAVLALGMHFHSRFWAREKNAPPGSSRVR